MIARMIDSYIYFFDRAMRVAKTVAPIGFIVPSTILNQVDARPLRSLLLNRGISALVSLGQGIFGTRVLNTSTILISSDVRNGNRLILGKLSSLPVSERQDALNRCATSGWTQWKRLAQRDPDLTFSVQGLKLTALLDRLRSKHILLSRIIRGEIQRGVSPDIAAAHLVSKAEARAKQLEQELLRPSISGRQIKRYHQFRSDQFIIYTSRETHIRKYPNTAKHLETFRKLNTCKEVGEGKHPWWSLHRPRNAAIFEASKFIGLTTAKTIELVFDAEGSLYVTDAMYVFQIERSYDPWVVSAVLQSRPFLWLYRVANQGESRVIPQVKASKLESLPYPKYQSHNRDIAKLRDYAKRMFELNTRKRSPKLAPSQLDRLEREIAWTDEQIDDLVYELYGITDEERKIIEESLKSS